MLLVSSHNYNIIGGLQAMNIFCSWQQQENLELMFCTFTGGHFFSMDWRAIVTYRTCIKLLDFLAVAINIIM